MAWSNLITGMNAGGHGIFDFIHRDPHTLQPYFSASRVEPPKHGIHLGNWVIPLGGGSAEQLRQGKSFWETLDDYGVPSLIFRMPSNFPPVKAKGHTLSGMGTPDLRGSYGTFSFYTDDPMSAAGIVEGGQIIPVEVKESQVKREIDWTGQYISQGIAAGTRALYGFRRSPGAGGQVHRTGREIRIARR